METYFKAQGNLMLNDKILLKDYSFSLEKDSSICILGESGSGKSFLLKSFLSSKNIECNGKCVFYFLEKLSENEFSKLNVPSSYKDFIDIFLSSKKNILYKYSMISKLLEKPDFFFCEDLHRILSRTEMSLFFKFLKEQHISCFYVTNSIEDVIYFSYLVVIKNNSIAMEGKTNLVLKEEKLMKVLGFSLPFYVNLSIQLKYYGLLETICVTKEELESMIWK